MATAYQSKCQALQQSAEWCEGNTELPGIRKRIYFTASSNVVERPEVPVDSLGRATSTIATGKYELRADRVFHYLEGIPNKNQYTSEPQGEIPCQSQLNKITFVYPSIDEDATGICLSINNTPSDIIFQDNKGRWRLLRNKYGDAKGTVKQDSGQGLTGDLATTLEAQSTDIIGCPFWTGDIPTEEGTVTLSAV